MKEVQQEILCVLLQTLVDKGLISQTVFERSRERIIGTLDMPDFFRDLGLEEDAHGCA